MTTLGFIGPSTSIEAVDGYHLIAGPGKFWSTAGTSLWNGSTCIEWGGEVGAEKRDRWLAFGAKVTAVPVTGVWFMLATRAETSPALAKQAAASAIVHIASFGVPVYLSAQPDYMGTCTICGEQGPARMAQIASELAATGPAIPGPVLPMLGVGDLLTDGCHLTEAGKRKLGTALFNFFG